MTNKKATPEQKKEMIEAVKKARDGNLPEYFEAAYVKQTLIYLLRSDAITDLVDKVKISAPPSISIAPLQEATMIDNGPKDLLEAAKAMCNALKNLNLKLDA